MFPTSLVLFFVIIVMLVSLEAAGEQSAAPAPFERAIATDDVDAVEKLLKEDPKLSDQRPSPLHLAAKHNARKSAEALLKAGADFYAHDENGQLPLDLAPGGELNDTRKYLREINKRRNEFLDAVGKSDVDRVTTLLAADKSLAGSRDIGDGWSAIMMACHFGSPKILQLLIDAGGPLNAVDFNNGQDALSVAAGKEQIECLRILLKAGMDPKRTWHVDYGRLPMEMNALHLAAWKGKGEVVAELLKAGVDVNARAKAYAVFSPLHFAATEGHTEIVKQLLAAGADKTARDGRRAITALEMAEAGKHEATATVLRP